MVEFAAIPKVDLSDAVVDRVRDAILLGELSPDDWLPSERELAVQFGVNRTTVREALMRLELLGLIERRHGKRCRVLDYRRTGSSSLVPYMTRLRIDGVAESLVESIAIFYEGTVALAVRRATDGDLAAIERAADSVEAAAASGDREAVVAADRDVHHAVAAAAHSVVLELQMASYYRSLDVALDAKGRVKQAQADVLVERVRTGKVVPHRRIAEAIAARDEGRARELAVALVTRSPGGRRSI